MKLALKLDAPSGTTFYPESRVEGTLHIRGLAQRPARIRASLKGTLKIWASARVYGTDSPNLTHALFEHHKEVKPSELIQELDEARQPVYSCKVSFQLPSKTRCCGGCGSCPLPPSLDVSDSEISIKSEYSLSVTVDRWVIGSVTKSTTARQILSFICDPPAIPTIKGSRSVILVPLQRLDEKDLVTMFGAGNTLPPPYSLSSASLRVEVLLPQPPVVLRGQPAPITLVITTPPDILRAKEVYLRSVATRLKTSVTAYPGTGPWNATVPRGECELVGRIRIEDEMFQLDSGAWGSLLVANSRPTFNSCLMQITHAVEVTVGVSLGLGEDIHYGLACVDVIVMDPPPAYDDNLSPISHRW